MDRQEEESMPSKTVAEKPKETKKTVKRLWHYLYEAKWLLLLSAVLMMASNLFSLVGPLLSGYAIDASESTCRPVHAQSDFQQNF